MQFLLILCRNFKLVYFNTFQELNSQIVNEIIEVLCKLLVQHPEHAIHVRVNFAFLLLPLVSKLLEGLEEDFETHQRKCVAVSILAEQNQQVLR